MHLDQCQPFSKALHSREAGFHHPMREDSFVIQSSSQSQRLTKRGPITHASENEKTKSKTKTSTGVFSTTVVTPLPRQKEMASTYYRSRSKSGRQISGWQMPAACKSLEMVKGVNASSVLTRPMEILRARHTHSTTRKTFDATRKSTLDGPL